MTPKAIILCTTPRSGSTLLCDLMAGTGVLGRPKSWYRAASIPDYQVRLGVADGCGFDARYLAAVRADGTDASGTFAMRLMWDHHAELQHRLAGFFPDIASERARIEAAFGPADFACLSRGDKVAQAVSRLRAEQSGLWHRREDGSVREQVGPTREPVYDADRIAAFIAEAEVDEVSWHGWFAREGIVPCEVHYEDLAADPIGTLGELLAALGRNPAGAGRAKVQSRKLADQQSRDWAARFQAEQALTAR